MKANELMVGDLVEYSSKYKHGIGKVAGIEPREGSVDPTTFTIIDENLMLIGVSRVNVKPIPLTPEILEKNGFTDWADHSRTTRSCSLLVDKTNIIVQKIDGTDYIFTQIHRGGAGSCEFRMDLKYVHELQHVLRLCGIEKEIVP